jgi:regulator of nucleoside diphosphate kinase
MTMTSSKFPPITIHTEDRARLEALAQASLTRFPQTAGYLAHELERARAPRDGEREFVRMGSIVRFRDDTTGQTRQVTLVYPDRADIAAGRVSVLTPIGAALIGLSEDQTISWQTPSGDWRPLTVLSVSAPELQPA